MVEGFGVRAPFRIPFVAKSLLGLLASIGATAHGEPTNGDQILDGIGETELIARYLFDGNLNDGSRNGWHASIDGEGSTFDEDVQFGKVLALPPGKSSAYVRISGRALADLESLSISGWVNIAAATGQCFFDLGTDEKRRLTLIPMGADPANGCHLQMVTPDSTQGPASFRIPTGQWVHLASVLDAPQKTLSLYVDGVRVSHTAGLKGSLSDVLSPEHPEGNRLQLGRGLFGDHGGFGGKLYDVRIYSSALSDRQIAVIRHNAISKDKIAVGGDVPMIGYREDKPRQLFGGLIGVADVKVETEFGHLPRLPSVVPGTYSTGLPGPEVRVIWPSPIDNSAVLRSGTYTLTGAVPGTVFAPKAEVTVVERSLLRESPKQVLKSFGLGRVTLNPDENGKPTGFTSHRDKFVTTLAKTDPDSFLYNFRDAFGQKQPEGVKPLGVWDSQTTRLRGHASGHYLTAIAQAYASTAYDPELQDTFAKKMDYMIDVLHELSRMAGKPTVAGATSNPDPVTIPCGPGKVGYYSDLSKEGIRTDYWNWGLGFISGYPPDQFIMLEQGATYGGANHQVWAPYYTLHKILAGLMDCYEVGGNPKALEVARDMSVWVYKRLKALPPDTRIKMWKSYIAGEYGGMNESMARLHRITGDARFLEGAKLFDNTNVFFGDAKHQHGLAKNVDTIRGLHSNQHIPQIIGALETYKGTRDVSYYKIADNFMEVCSKSYMYSIGGVAGARNPANAECFTAEPDSLFKNGMSDGGQNETCATYNLLKLGRELFMFDRDAKHMDYYERALYNHILASVDEDNPGNTYHVPLNPGAKKTFGNAKMDGFTCCNGTALESGTKLQDSIYLRSTDDRELYVNLYVPSVLDWAERNVKVTQSTSFPYSDTSSLILKGSGDFVIHVRVPGWASKGFHVKINGKEEAVEGAPGSYVALKREWQDGDKIELRMPMGFHFSALMDQPNIASIFYGPILLAAEESEPRTTWREVNLSAKDPASSFAGDPKSLRFRADNTSFKPFHDFYQGNHSVYLDIKFAN